MGETPLYLEVIKGHGEVARVLFDAGAPIFGSTAQFRITDDMAELLSSLGPPHGAL
jgi:hypothetical protein